MKTKLFEPWQRSCFSDHWPYFLLINRNFRQFGFQKEALDELYNKGFNLISEPWPKTKLSEHWPKFLSENLHLKLSEFPVNSTKNLLNLEVSKLQSLNHIF